jgi:hypothetical protein
MFKISQQPISHEQQQARASLIAILPAALGATRRRAAQVFFAFNIRESQDPVVFVTFHNNSSQHIAPT